jgi:hypothetical protein
MGLKPNRTVDGMRTKTRNQYICRQRPSLRKSRFNSTSIASNPAPNWLGAMAKIRAMPVAAFPGGQKSSSGEPIPQKEEQC